MTPMKYFGDNIRILVSVSTPVQHTPTPSRPYLFLPTARSQSIYCLNLLTRFRRFQMRIAATSDHGIVEVVSHFTHPESDNI